MSSLPIFLNPSIPPSHQYGYLLVLPYDFMYSLYSLSSHMMTCTPFLPKWIFVLCSLFISLSGAVLRSIMCDYTVPVLPVRYGYLHSLSIHLNTSTHFHFLWLSELPSLQYEYMYFLPSHLIICGCPPLPSHLSKCTCTPFPPLWLPVLPSLSYGYLYSLPSPIATCTFFPPY